MPYHSRKLSVADAECTLTGDALDGSVAAVDDDDEEPVDGVVDNEEAGEIPFPNAGASPPLSMIFASWSWTSSGRSVPECSKNAVSEIGRNVADLRLIPFSPVFGALPSRCASSEVADEGANATLSSSSSPSSSSSSSSDSKSRSLSISVSEENAVALEAALLSRNRSTSSINHAMGSTAPSSSRSSVSHDSGSLNILSANALPGTGPNDTPEGIAGDISGDSRKSSSAGRLRGGRCIFVVGYSLEATRRDGGKRSRAVKPWIGRAHV